MHWNTDLEARTACEEAEATHASLSQYTSQCEEAGLGNTPSVASFSEGHVSDIIFMRLSMTEL